MSFTALTILLIEIVMWCCPWCADAIFVSREEDLWSPLRWLHNGRDSVLNHQPHDCLLDRLFRHRSKKISKLHVTSLCAGNSLVTGEFPAQMANYAENASIWWRHHGSIKTTVIPFTASQHHWLAAYWIHWNTICLPLAKNLLVFT